MASNARILQDWFNTTTLDHNFCTPLSWICLLHLTFPDLPQTVKENPLLISVWRSWVVIQRHLGLSPHHSLYQLFLGNPSFQNGKPHPILRARSRKGITQIRDLTETSTQAVLSFSQASTKFAFLDTDFFHFLQIQRVMHSGHCTP